MKTVVKTQTYCFFNKHCRRAFRWYKDRWPWIILNSEKPQVLMIIVLRFLTANSQFIPRVAVLFL